MGKKYMKIHNPINKPVMVAVPRWEYAALVAAQTRLDIIEQMLSMEDKYVHLNEVPKLIFAPGSKEEIE